MLKTKKQVRSASPSEQGIFLQDFILTNLSIEDELKRDSPWIGVLRIRTVGYGLRLKRSYSPPQTLRLKKERKLPFLSFCSEDREPECRCPPQQEERRVARYGDGKREMCTRNQAGSPM